MNAGDLRDRVVILQLQQTQDEDTGEIRQTWAEFGKFWGKILFLSSKEMVQAQALNSELKARLMLRYTSQTAKINSTMQVVYRHQTYQLISSPIPDNQSGKEWLTLELSTV